MPFPADLGASFFNNNFLGPRKPLDHSKRNISDGRLSQSATPPNSVKIINYQHQAAKFGNVGDNRLGSKQV
jgi:hypothetical protein